MSNANKKLMFRVVNVKDTFVNERYDKVAGCYRLLKSKAFFISFLRELDWLHIFSYDQNVIKFSLHKANSSKLIAFLINFYDNIIRDVSSIVNKNYSFGNSYAYSWTLKDLRIIANKIKKVLRYFFYFIDYYSISSVSFMLSSYNYFKLFISSTALVRNVSGFLKIFNSLRLKKNFKFEYLLLNKVINKNHLIRYSNNTWFQKPYKKTYKKNKIAYISFLKKLKKIKLKSLQRKKTLAVLLRLSNFSKIYALDNNFLLVNFFNFNIFYIKRTINYQKFLIRKVYLHDKNPNNKNCFKKIFYKKNFLYFNDYKSSRFYRTFHIGGWDDKIINIFNFKTSHKALKDYIKANYQLFQKNYFNELLWSWHLIFSRHKPQFPHLLNFFNPLKLTESFNYLFFKVYKLRSTVNYLFFLMLPLNFNLIWSEVVSKNKNMFRVNTLDVIGKKMNKANWFFKNSTVVKKIKNFVISKLSFKKRPRHRFAKKLLTLAFMKKVLIEQIGGFQKIKKQTNGAISSDSNYRNLILRKCCALSLSCFSLKFFFKYRPIVSFYQKKKYFLRFFFLKKHVWKSDIFINFVKNQNVYYKQYSSLLLKKKINKFLFKLSSTLEGWEYTQNNNFFKKNCYSPARHRDFSYNIFSVLNSILSPSSKSIINIKLPSRYYQNVLLYNVVKNKELLHQVSCLYEFENEMCDYKFSVYQNKLKGASQTLFYMYSNFSLVISNFFINLSIIKKIWANLFNRSYLWFSLGQLYFLDKSGFYKSMLFV